MIPFGPKLNTVFASRWKALLWAGGILLTAYCTVPSADDTADSDEGAQVLAQAMSQAPDQVEQVRPNDPWAIDRK